MEKQLSSNKARKHALVADLLQKLSGITALFLTDYRGLTHIQMEKLRRALKKAEGELLVAKNRLIKIALTQWKQGALSPETLKQLTDVLNEPTALLLLKGEEINPIKIISTFINEHQLPKIKIGFLGGNVITEADFKKLATLPPKDVLLTTLVYRLNSPIANLHHALSWNLVKLATVLGNIQKKQ